MERVAEQDGERGEPDDSGRVGVKCLWAVELGTR